MGIDRALTYFEASFRLEAQKNIMRLRITNFTYLKPEAQERLKAELDRAARPAPEARQLTPELLQEILNS